MNAIYSFIIDGDPKFDVQARVFVTTLLNVGIHPSNIFAHCTPTASRAITEFVLSLGVRTVPLTPFLDEKYCNKLVQLDTLLSHDADFYVLCDTDLAFVESIESLFDPAHIRAKPVDLPNPPLERLNTLRLMVGLYSTGRIVKTSCEDANTWSVNCNGGLYIIPKSFAARLSDGWKRFAMKLRQFPATFRQWYVHVDQVAFAMAMLDMKEDVVEIPIEYNFPIRLIDRFDNFSFCKPKVLHYHWLQNDDGMLSKTGNVLVDAAISEINAILSTGASSAKSNVVSALGQPAAPKIRPKCWGIGLGRTGTNSLCSALRMLGYERVAHNPRFEVLKDLDGGADNGVTIFYKYLDYKFPRSRFILTERDLESWLVSMEYANSVYTLGSLDDDIPIMRRMTLYETVTFDREKYIASYHRHRAEVMRHFSGRDDLLIMNIIDGDGWEKLCPFLGLDVPRYPFPHAHKRGEQYPPEFVSAHSSLPPARLSEQTNRVPEMTVPSRFFSDSGIGVYVVSLSKAVQRRSKIEDKLGAAGLEFRFIDAIDGDQAASVRTGFACDHGDEERYYLHRSSPISQRELACTLSHVRAIMAAQRAGLDGVLIVEDDVELLCREPRTLRGVIDRAPADAAYLQFQMSPHLTIERLHQRFGESGELFVRKKRTPSTSFADPTLSDATCHGTVAYFVTSQGMRNLGKRYIGDGVVLFPCTEAEVSSNMALVSDKFIYWALATDDSCHGYACSVPLFATDAVDSYLHEDHLPRHREARLGALSIFEQHYETWGLPS